MCNALLILIDHSSRNGNISIISTVFFLNYSYNNENIVQVKPFILHCSMSTNEDDDERQLHRTRRITRWWWPLSFNIIVVDRPLQLSCRRSRRGHNFTTNSNLSSSISSIIPYYMISAREIIWIGLTTKDVEWLRILQ